MKRRYIAKENTQMRSRMRWYLFDTKTNEPAQWTENQGVQIPIYYTELGVRGAVEAANQVGDFQPLSYDDYCAALVAKLEQIERLSREADRAAVDVASMLGDIARAALAKVPS